VRLLTVTRSRAVVRVSDCAVSLVLKCGRAACAPGTMMRLRLSQKLLSGVASTRTMLSRITVSLTSRAPSLALLKQSVTPPAVRTVPPWAHSANARVAMTVGKSFAFMM